VGVEDVRVSVAEIHSGVGGPAFPLTVHDPRTGESATYYGMTLRDYFAANAPALPSPIRDAFVRTLKRGGEVDLHEYAEVSARWAVVYADAMLKARQA
jgi:hypothetical protein